MVLDWRRHGYPEYGGAGAITKLMRQAFQDMLANKGCVVLFAPFSYKIFVGLVEKKC